MLLETEKDGEKFCPPGGHRLPHFLKKLSTSLVDSSTQYWKWTPGKVGKKDRSERVVSVCIMAFQCTVVRFSSEMLPSHKVTNVKAQSVRELNDQCPATLLFFVFFIFVFFSRMELYCEDCSVQRFSTGQRDRSLSANA